MAQSQWYDRIGRLLLLLAILGIGLHTSLFSQEPGSVDRPNAKSTDHSEEIPPNVVFILADDIGYGDLSCYGATAVSTPNIDRLASEGARFTDAHAAGAMCTPSRYGLLTGRYPFRTPRAAMAIDPLEPLIIETRRYTLGRLFQDAGYVTGCIGKWHLGFDVEQPNWNGELKPGPLEVGFDECFCVPYTNDRVPCVYVQNHRVVGLDPSDPIHIEHYGSDRSRRFSQLAGQRRIGHMQGGRAALWKDEEIGSTLTQRAVEFIERNRDRPFFLYFPTVAIHIPLTPGSRFHGTSKCGVYGDFIHELDWSVGEVLRTLDRNSLTNNTLVVFTSDNGATPGPRIQHRTNGVLRGSKGQIYEGGHRVPFVARWPGRVVPGRVCDDLIGLTDMLATSAALVGRALPEEAGPDSVNVLSSLVGGPVAEPTRATWMVHAGPRRSLAVREGDWKLIIPPPLTTPDGLERGLSVRDFSQCELHNLTRDLSEKSNLAEEHPELVLRLLKIAQQELDRDYEPSDAVSRPKGSGKKMTAARPGDL